MHRVSTSGWLFRRGICKISEENEIRSFSVQEKIKANTKTSRSHLTPEIALRLITSDCKLFHTPIQDDENQLFKSDPFWAFYWPGGQAISRFILDSPSIVKDRSVLDIGSGSGACSIAAKMSGARAVTANDIDNDAAVAAQLNADLNGVTISTCSKNLIGDSCEQFDVVLVGDVFYDSSIAAEMFPWLKSLRNKGKEIFIGDPGRHGLTTEVIQAMQKIITYELPENCCIENNGFKYANVWNIK